ncbi:MAG: hypothetical protein ACFFD4_11145 [Candidatus Odinarchaeota archaeon]
MKIKTALIITICCVSIMTALIGFGNGVIDNNTDSFAIGSQKSVKNANSNKLQDFPANTFPTLELSTFFGGSADECNLQSPVLPRVRSLVDSNNSVILVGRTASIDFPVKNAYQSTNNGSIDVILAKFSSQGNLIFSTYFGGSGNDWGVCAAVDSQDNIIIGGSTTSDDFPLKNEFKSSFVGLGANQLDDFYAKFTPDGDLLFSSYFGGNGDDWLHALALDSHDNIILVGDTGSTDLPMVNAYQNTHKSSLYNAYLAKFNASGQELLFSTYFGGTNAYNWFIDCKIDDNDSIYLTGGSNSANFPLLDPYQPQLGGARDATFVKFFENGSLAYSSFLGGSSYDYGESITVTPQGDVVIVGHTLSNDFPLQNAFQNTSAGGMDAFACKITANGTLLFSTYLGGVFNEEGWSVAVDHLNNILITGKTESSNFPTTTNALASEIKGITDAYITILSPQGTMLYSSFLGGNSLDQGRCILCDKTGRVIIIGLTTSTDFPVVNAYQNLNRGSYDYFITIFSYQLHENTTTSGTTFTTTSRVVSGNEFSSPIASLLLVGIIVVRKRKPSHKGDPLTE